MVKPNKTSDTIFTRGKWSFRNKTISQFTRDTESNLYIFFLTSAPTYITL